MKGLNRIFAILLTVVMLAATPALTAFAGAEAGSGCTHTAHGESCGYTAGAECAHVCGTDTACGYSAGEACGHVCAESEACAEGCAHTSCDEACGYAEAAPCGHAQAGHNAACGYVAAAPCTHVCGTACGVATQPPANEPDGPAPATHGVIAGFAALEAEEMTVAPGTAQADIGLPGTVLADVQAGGGTAQTALAAVWAAVPEYDPETPDEYLFTADVGKGYTLAEGVVPPAILVSVGEAAPAGVITAFDALPEAVAEQSYGPRTPIFDITPNLPATLGATVNGEAAQVPVSWDTESYTPLGEGPFVFEAQLGEGYTLEPENLPLPAITVVRSAANGLTRLAGVYNTADIAVVNTIIDDNGLAWTKAPADGSAVPADWTGAVWSADASNKRLTSLEINSKDLQGVLDLRGLTALESLKCTSNRLTALELAGLTALVELACGGNRLAALDVSGLSALFSLQCGENPLASLTLGALPGLKYLRCYNSQLTALNVSGLPALVRLECDNNALASLTLGQQPDLEVLLCGNNRLAALDVSGLPALKELACSSNLLTGITLGTHNALTSLDVSNNLLTSLDVSALGGITTLRCNQNRLTGLALCSSAPYTTVQVHYNYFASEAAITGVPGGAAWGAGGYTYNPQHTGGFCAVTDITGVPAQAQPNVPLTLTATVLPADATNQTIEWSVYSFQTTAPGATITGGNILTTTGEGNVVVTALIQNGTSAGAIYTKRFTITVKADAAQVPSRPQGLAATPGYAALTLNWTPPASDGGSPILKYQISYTGNNSIVQWRDIPNSGPDTTSYVLTGLMNNTEYLVKLRAVNATGNGILASVAATPDSGLDTAPNPPQSLAATPGNTQVALAWAAPAPSGGSPIQKYQYCATTGGADSWQDIPSSGPGTTGYTVTGLTNGTAYTFKVRAVNAKGVGAAAVAAATPNALPAAPISLAAAPDDGQVTLSWTEADDAEFLDKYQYCATAAGGTDSWQDIPSSGPGTTGYTVTGLSNGTAYTFKVRGVNSAGAGAVATATATPYKITYHPGDIAVINSMIDHNGLGWTKAAEGGNAPADWTGVSWNSDPAGARITGLLLEDLGLHGTLDVSALALLQTLDCGTNQLTALPSLPNSLEMLDCGENQLTALPALPASLKELMCGGNRLTALPALPAGLQELMCNNNRLTAMPALPAGLVTLECSANPLGSLGGLPASLEELQCANSQLTSLNLSGAAGLTGLNCQNNLLASLDVSGLASLETLRCSYNQLTALDVSAQTRLIRLDCEQNKLQTLKLANSAAYTLLSVNYNYLPATTAVTGTPGHVVWDTGNFTFTPQHTTGDGFVAATGIAGMPTLAVVGVPLALTGTVYPQNATGQTIVWRVEDPGGTGAQIAGSTLTATGTGTAFIKATIINGMAIGVDLEIGMIIPIQVAAAAAPGAPTGLAATAGSGQAALSWGAAPSNNSAILRYQYSASAGADNWQDIPNSGPGTTRYTVTGLAGGTAYTLKVRAVNAMGAGAAASIPFALPKTEVSGSISFAGGTAPYTGAAQTYEAATIGISQGPNPGWTYTYAVQPGSGGSLLGGVPLTAGSYTVTATYEDDQNKGSKTATFTIAPKVLSVSGAQATPRAYDGTATVAVGGTLNGVVNNEAVTLAPTGTAAGKNAGTHAVTFALSGDAAVLANYTLTQPGATVVISQKELTVTNSTATNRPYNGTTTVSVGGTLNGVVGGEGVSLTGSVPDPDAGAGKQVTFALSGSAAVLANYTLTPPGSVTVDITRRPVTVVADSKTITVGDAMPALTYTIRGIVPGEGVADVFYDATPHISCPGANTNAAGTYTIIAGVAGVNMMPNYMLGSPEYENGTLTVKAKPSTPDPAPSSPDSSSSSSSASSSGSNSSPGSSSSPDSSASGESSSSQAQGGDASSQTGSSIPGGENPHNQLDIEAMRDSQTEVPHGETFFIAAAEGSLAWDEAILDGYYDGALGGYVFTPLQQGETKIIYTDENGDEHPLDVLVSPPVPLAGFEQESGFPWWGILLIALAGAGVILSLVLVARRRRQR